MKKAAFVLGIVIVVVGVSLLAAHKTPVTNYSYTIATQPTTIHQWQTSSDSPVSGIVDLDGGKSYQVSIEATGLSAYSGSSQVEISGPQGFILTQNASLQENPPFLIDFTAPEWGNYIITLTDFGGNWDVTVSTDEQVAVPYSSVKYPYEWFLAPGFALLVLGIGAAIASLLSHSQLPPQPPPPQLIQALDEHKAATEKLFATPS